MFKWLTLSFLLLCCSNKKPHTEPLDAETVLRLKSLRSDLLAEYYDHTSAFKGGWPSDHDCDSALWAGEGRAADIYDIDISLALQSDGRPTRLPGKDCPLDQTSATTSTDMQLGTVIGLFAAKDLDGLRAMSHYADVHNGIMGMPADKVSLTLMKPGIKAHLAKAIHNLGGPSSVWENFPQVYTPPQSDYQLHLEMLSIYQILVTHQNIDDMTAKTLSKEASNNPSDALVQAVAGNSVVAASLILNLSYQLPIYVRGPMGAPYVHKLFVLHVLLRSYP